MPEAWIVTLTVTGPGALGIVRVRRLLKSAGRAHGLRCIAVACTQPSPAPPPRTRLYDRHLEFTLQIVEGGIQVRTWPSSQIVRCDTDLIHTHEGRLRLRETIISRVPFLNNFDSKVALHRAIRQLAYGAAMAGPPIDAQVMEDQENE